MQNCMHQLISHIYIWLLIINIMKTKKNGYALCSAVAVKQCLLFSLCTRLDTKLKGE